MYFEHVGHELIEDALNLNVLVPVRVYYPWVFGLMAVQPVVLVHVRASSVLSNVQEGLVD